MQDNSNSFTDSYNIKTELWNESPERSEFPENDSDQHRREETPLQREIRLAKDAARVAEKRRKETSTERTRRLAKDAARAAERRKRESDSDRQRRLATDAEKRRKEPSTERRRRLAKDAARVAERRKRESDSDRQMRLATDAARHASKRSHNRQERHSYQYQIVMDRKDLMDKGLGSVEFQMDKDIKMDEFKSENQDEVTFASKVTNDDSVNMEQLNEVAYSVEIFYQCEMCPKNFSTPSDLKRHYEVHTGEKPHKLKKNF